jgi:hypothetical protein
MLLKRRKAHDTHALKEAQGARHTCSERRTRRMTHMLLKRHKVHDTHALKEAQGAPGVQLRYPKKKHKKKKPLRSLKKINNNNNNNKEAEDVPRVPLRSPIKIQIK